MPAKKIGDKIRFRPCICVHEDGRAPWRTGTVVWIHSRGYFVVVEYEVTGILGQGSATLTECLHLPENDSRAQLTDNERHRAGEAFPVR